MAKYPSDGDEVTVTFEDGRTITMRGHICRLLVQESAPSENSETPTGDNLLEVALRGKQKPLYTVSIPKAL